MKLLFKYINIILLILIFSNVVHAQQSVNTINGYPNATSIGTTINELAKLTGAGTVVISSAGDTSGVVGIVINGAGTSGSATVQSTGVTSCVFSTGITQNDYVGISSTVNGNCADVGSTYPTANEVIGRVVSPTNASTGTYRVILNLDTTSTNPAISGANMTSNTIPSAALANTAVSPGNYTSSNITVNAEGQVTAAANGSSGSGGGVVTHTLSGVTPVAVVNSSSAPSIDVENLLLSANVTSFTLPAAAAVADGEVLSVKIKQAASGGPWTLPIGTASSPFAAGSGTVIVNSVPGGCPTIGTTQSASAPSEIDITLNYKSTLTEWLIKDCTTVHATQVTNLSGVPFGLGFNFTGTQTGSAILAYTCPATLNFPANFTNPTTQVSCGTNPGESDTYTVKVAGSSIGTIILNTACSTTLATTGGATQSCIIGQRLEIDQSSTASGASVSLVLGYYR